MPIYMFYRAFDQLFDYNHQHHVHPPTVGQLRLIVLSWIVVLCCHRLHVRSVSPSLALKKSNVYVLKNLIIVTKTMSIKITTTHMSIR